jgi:hypothetical protein
MECARHPSGPRSAVPRTPAPTCPAVGLVVAVNCSATSISRRRKRATSISTRCALPERPCVEAIRSVVRRPSGACAIGQAHGDLLPCGPMPPCGPGYPCCVGVLALGDHPKESSACVLWHRCRKECQSAHVSAHASSADQLVRESRTPDVLPKKTSAQPAGVASVVQIGRCHRFASNKVHECRPSHHRSRDASQTAEEPGGTSRCETGVR